MIKPEFNAIKLGPTLEAAREAIAGEPGPENMYTESMVERLLFSAYFDLENNARQAYADSCDDQHRLFIYEYDLAGKDAGVTDKPLMERLEGLGKIMPTAKEAHELILALQARIDALEKKKKESQE